MQDEYIEALNALNKTLTHAYKVNREIKFEVFIHKVDGISDDSKIELQRDISQRASLELAEAGLGSELHLR
jgi:Ras-related GTP-binding protein C/D